MLKEAAFQWILQHAYAGLFSCLMLGIAGLPIPDEVLLTFAGYLIYKGHLLPFPTAAAAFLGSVCGISLSYTLGRTLGLRLLRRYGPVVHVSAEKLEQAHDWFRRVGKWALVFGYYVPGIRHLTAYVAGSFKLELRVFAPFAYSGGLLWSVSFLSLGYLAGEQWAAVTTKLHWNLLIASGAVAILLLLFLFLQRRRNAAKSR